MKSNKLTRQNDENIQDDEQNNKAVDTTSNTVQEMEQTQMKNAPTEAIMVLNPVDSGEKEINLGGGISLDIFGKKEVRDVHKSLAFTPSLDAKITALSKKTRRSYNEIVITILEKVLEV